MWLAVVSGYEGEQLTSGLIDGGVSQLFFYVLAWLFAFISLPAVLGFLALCLSL